MADYSRGTPTGWSQGDDTSDFSRVSPSGWEQAVGTGGAGGVFVPIVGRGPGMALASNGGGLVGNTGAAA